MPKLRRLGSRGFTFIELLIVLAIMALLSSLVVSISVGKIRQSKESALKEDLYQMRKAIDDDYADSGKYPKALSELVDHRYLRVIPEDPFTRSVDTWVLEISKDPAQRDGIVDVHSGSEEKSSDGGNYSDW
ncbi:MAG: type II secretion system protein [bacterium]